MIRELISKVLTIRNAAHIEHWKTTNHAAHVALGEFYDSILGQIDEIVEVYQGQYGLINGIAVDTPKAHSDIVKYIASDAEWIVDHRNEISDDCETIGALLDGLAATYLRTAYKLRAFK